MKNNVRDKLISKIVVMFSFLQQKACNIKNKLFMFAGSVQESFQILKDSIPITSGTPNETNEADNHTHTLYLTFGYLA